MPRRQPPPRLWLMTDERQDDALWLALDRLPRGAGIVFRHHRTPPGERRALFRAVRAVARARRLTLVLAAPPALAAAWRADGAHGRDPARTARPLLRTAPVHNLRERRAAGRAGAELLFLSPVFATRSHPGGRVLGPVRFGSIARGAGRVIALGGMDAHRARRTAALGGYGWAAIDALTTGDGPNRGADEDGGPLEADPSRLNAGSVRAEPGAGPFDRLRANGGSAGGISR